MDTEKAEVTLRIRGQWYYRGDRAPSWFVLGDRADGSPSGIAERVPKRQWPKLERYAAALGHA